MHHKDLFAKKVKAGQPPRTSESRIEGLLNPLGDNLVV
jgi:hypothetical protein